eukprot:gene11862-12006_t
MLGDYAVLAADIITDYERLDGTCMSERSLITLDPVVPFERWVQAGRVLNDVFIAEEGLISAGMNLQTAAYVPPTSLNVGTAAASTWQSDLPAATMLPACVGISQADVEAVLTHYLQDIHGVSVERNTTLESFTMSEDGSVQCILAKASPGSSAAASHEHVTASHLIACDGARSTVRKQLNVSFAGTTLPQRWLLADCSYEVDMEINPNKPSNPAENVPFEDSLVLNSTSVGTMAMFPIGARAKWVRIVWNAESFAPQGAPSLELMQTLLVDHTRYQIRLTQMHWTSEFTINERQVASYLHHDGHVLLAGDAAHVHSPAGGQGMNTGIQDAANLAWKVALAASGARTGTQLLRSYQEERWPVGHRVIQRSGRTLRANTIQNIFLKRLRSILLNVALRLPFVRSNLLAFLTEDDINYANGSLSTPLSNQTAATPAAVSNAAGGTTADGWRVRRAVWGSCRPGMIFPSVSVKIGGSTRPATDLLREHPGTLGCLVLLPDAEADATVWPLSWGSWKLHVVQVTPNLPGNSSADGGVQDAWGLLAASLSGRTDVGVLVRPDGYVAAVGGPQQLQAWLDLHCA